MALFSALTLSSCKKDPCKNVSCQDGNCRCNLPWEGSKCEVDARDKFAGAWQGTQNCGSGPEQVSFSIIKSASVATRIIIDSDFYGELTSSNAFSIPNQTIDADGVPVTLNGNGIVNGNQITMTLVFVVSGTSFTCTITANKQ